MNRFLVGLVCLFYLISCKDSNHESEDSETPDNTPLLTINTTVTKDISPYFFGQNYWSWVDEWGAQVKGTESQVESLQLDILRIGGTEADRSYPHAFDTTKILDALNYAREVGAEPIIQLPTLNDWNTNPASVQSAVEIVQFIQKSDFQVEYFSIGNEPDIYVEQGVKESHTAEETATFFNVISDTVKAINSSFKIIGPDLAWKYYQGNNWLSPFLSLSNSKMDILSVHRYPFAPENATKENVIDDAESFRSDINMIKGYLNTVNKSAMPIAITETHVSYDGDPSFSTQTGSPQTFWAAFWAADVIGVALEEELWNLSFWSISEGWTLGFIDGGTKLPRPTFHVLKLLANQLGDKVLEITNKPNSAKVYATLDSETQAVQVLFLNSSENSSTIKWKLQRSTGTQEMETTLDPNSITLLVYSSSNSLTSWRYTESHANQNMEPQQN
ncbi:hypothetical protein EP331_04640 [bacterium]|nr:MAG: hypothetical protein EP331_04640 [bacterium]